MIKYIKKINITVTKKKRIEGVHNSPNQLGYNPGIVDEIKELSSVTTFLE
jgi:hypothetical protein